jgi:hypothetical protein
MNPIEFQKIHLQILQNPSQSYRINQNLKELIPNLSQNLLFFKIQMNSVQFKRILDNSDGFNGKSFKFLQIQISLF